MVCFEDKCFMVEIADTPEERAEGLMFRESLEPDKGMLFVFGQESEYGFWMKNTIIPLDIIWINSDGEVVFISKETRPCDESCPFIRPDRKAKYVLELNAGVSDEIVLGIGDKIKIKNL
ncbi:MAG: DUF192 domain-containing protein [Candidatus Aenigmarchaeota archaeon]